MTKERSAGGQPILRHDKLAEGTDEVSHADDERLTKHIEQHFGPSGMVFHEIVSSRVHIDVLTFPPSEKHPFWLLVTSGMSARPMNVQRIETPEDWQHAELCALLPRDWPLTEQAFRDERNYWPIRLLKSLARLPHDYNTWLGWGHSIPNGDPAEPYAKDTELAGAVLIPPYMLGPDFFTPTGMPPLHVFQVLPVTPHEMNVKLAVGVDGLLEQLEKLDGDIYGPIDPRRSALRP